MKIKSNTHLTETNEKAENRFNVGETNVTVKPSGRVTKAPGLEKAASDILHRIGIPDEAKGSRYLRKSILLSAESF